MSNCLQVLTKLLQKYKIDHFLNQSILDSNIYKWVIQDD